ncbi:MAG: GAF and ANTAR domain-containing protein [Desulfobacteraceae bacterium]|nr:GAF and ANTAR domain-containing protein [Desulfobacteraceae bacterium]
MKNKEEQAQDKYIKTLMDISRAITSDLFHEDLLKLIVLLTAKMVGADICSLWLIDENENPPKIKLTATQSIEPEYVKDRALNLNEGVVGHVVTTQKPLVIKNVMRSRRFKEKEMAKKLGLVSMVGVPLKLRDKKIVGVLNCFTSVSYDFSKTEINALTTVANQAAVAILNTELMVKTKVIQEELESRKLIEKAKEILMSSRQLKGDEAYRWIQKRSMDSRKTMRQVSEAIILSDEIFQENK